MFVAVVLVVILPHTSIQEDDHPEINTVIGN